jgi:acetyl esterase/lipase
VASRRSNGAMNRSNPGQVFSPRRPWVVLLLVLLVAGCGGSGGQQTSANRRRARSARIEWVIPARPIEGLRQHEVGQGPRGAVILSSPHSVRPRRIVIFLHGWEATPPSIEAAWISHLADAGATVVYPVYQDNGTGPREFSTDLRAGVRAALRSLDFDAHDVVVIGRTTGGALAFDYAATAKRAGLPVPAAVLAVFPGSRPPSGRIPQADLAHIPSGTRLDVVAGRGDRLPGGDPEARHLLAAASSVPLGRRRLLTPRFPAEPSLVPPARVLAAERRSFWMPADRLIASVEGG